MASAFGLIASLMWGGSYFVGGRLSGRVSAYAVTFASSVVTALFFLFFGLLRDRMSFDHLDVATGIFAGVTTLLGNVCLFSALSKGPMGVISGISALLVVIPLAWSVSTGDALTTAAVIGVLLAVGGVILLGAPEMRGNTTRTAVVLALLSALFFGSQQVAIAQGSQDDAYVTLFLAQAVVVVLIGIVGVARRSNGGASRADLPAMVFVGLANGIAFAAYAEGTRLGDPGLVSVLASLDPVIVAVLALIVLKQRMAVVQVAALGMVIVGGATIALA